MFDLIKEAFKKDKVYIEGLTKRYLKGDYIKVKSTNDIKRYYDVPKDTMCVLNEKHIYVYTGDKYYWSRFKYDQKNERLVRIMIYESECSNHDIKHGSDYEFRPGKVILKELKNKDELNLTEKEKIILKDRERNLTMTVIFIIAFVISIISKFCIEVFGQ